MGEDVSTATLLVIIIVGLIFIISAVTYCLIPLVDAMRREGYLKRTCGNCRDYECMYRCCGRDGADRDVDDKACSEWKHKIEE